VRRFPSGPITYLIRDRRSTTILSGSNVNDIGSYGSAAHIRGYVLMRLLDNLQAEGASVAPESGLFGKLSLPA